MYLLQSQKTDWYKIGFSSDPARRVVELNKEIGGLDWHLMAAIPSKDPRRLEKAFHAVLAPRRITRGKEWFVLGASEVELFLALASEGEQIEEGTPAWWPKVMQYLLDQRQPLSAAHFDEASAAWFEGHLLRVLFPQNVPPIFVSLARHPRHTQALQDAVEAVFGKRPVEVRCEVQEPLRS